MKNLCILFVIALVSTQTMGFRLRRQATDQDLEDRYGWEQAWIEQGQISGQFPGQGQFPQFPGQGQFPGRFPGQGQFPQFPGQGQFPGQFPGGQRTTTTTAPTTTTAASSGDAALVARRTCMARCPVTSEYNPVCGSDDVTYNNPGQLGCAQSCGVQVTLARTARCPPPTPAP